MNLVLHISEDSSEIRLKALNKFCLLVSKIFLVLCDLSDI